MDKNDPKPKKLNIGILTKAPKEDKHLSKLTYITGHYVKWIESFGHNVIPIPYDLPIPDLDKILLQINGLVCQGAVCRIKWPYSEIEAKEIFTEFNHLPMEMVVEHIVNKTLNNPVNPLPLFFVCWGMELLPLILTNKTREEVFVNSKNCRKVNMNLESIVKDSILFSVFNEQEFKMLEENKQTFHNHANNIPVSFLEENESLRSLIKVTSASRDSDDLKFVSSYEFIHFPIFALQFHPEKIGNIMHIDLSNNEESVKINRKFGEAFWKICRKNTNEILDEKLIISSDVEKVSAGVNRWNVGFEVKNNTPYYIFKL